MKGSNYFKLLLILLIAYNSQCLSREKRYIAFPKTGSIGLFLAVAVPVGPATNNVFMAYNFEASYTLPVNTTIEEGVGWETVDATESRSQVGLNRTIAYKLIESKIEHYGYPGQECLLRTICELSASFIAHNGVLGEILNVVFLPSTSMDEQLSDAYSQAEKDGKNGICKKYHAICKKSFLDLFSGMLR